jgi:hypothetical protein
LSSVFTIAARDFKLFIYLKGTANGFFSACLIRLVIVYYF